jgi:hypothetical protein
MKQASDSSTDHGGGKQPVIVLRFRLAVPGTARSELFCRRPAHGASRARRLVTLSSAVFWTATDRLNRAAVRNPATRPPRSWSHLCRDGGRHLHTLMLRRRLGKGYPASCAAMTSVTTRGRGCAGRPAARGRRRLTETLGGKSHDQAASGLEKIFCSVGINRAVSGSRLLEAALA